MTILAAMSTKEEWEKLTEQTNKIDAELKRRGELLS